MAAYYYPQVVGSYRWNTVERCADEVGVRPSGISDVAVDGVMKTVIEFDRDLTAAELTKLNTLMADNPQYPPTTIEKIQIVDLYEDFAAYKAACNLPNLKMYYDEAVRGSGVVNRIVLCHATPLTTNQKKLMRDNYATGFKG